ncbi:hypothetical protein P7C70_g6407, partial [Phenoliferia sp. Uapishka_3]
MQRGGSGLSSRRNHTNPPCPPIRALSPSHQQTALQFHRPYNPNLRHVHFEMDTVPSHDRPTQALPVLHCKQLIYTEGDVLQDPHRTNGALAPLQLQTEDPINPRRAGSTQEAVEGSISQATLSKVAQGNVEQRGGARRTREVAMQPMPDMEKLKRSSDRRVTSHLIGGGNPTTKHFTGYQNRRKVHSAPLVHASILHPISSEVCQPPKHLAWDQRPVERTSSATGNHASLNRKQPNQGHEEPVPSSTHAASNRDIVMLLSSQASASPGT